MEAIFRRAGYSVSRVGRESQIHRLVKLGRDEFLPDFLVPGKVYRDNARALHQLLPVEAKYRRQGNFRPLERTSLERLAARWPDLRVVLVTDNPEAGRSCFQALELSVGQLRARDLHAADLDIQESMVREFEELVRDIFPLVERRLPGAVAMPAEASS